RCRRGCRAWQSSPSPRQPSFSPPAAPMRARRWGARRGSRASPAGRRRAASWVEQPLGPAVDAAREQPSLMQPMRTVVPIFDPVRDQAIAAPMRGPRDVCALEPVFYLFKSCLEDFSALERARLIRRPRTELGIAAADRKIGVRFRVAHQFDRSFDAYLPAQR